MNETHRFQAKLPDAARTRAAAAGDAGRRWLRDLDNTVNVLRRRWDLRLGEVLTGGSESLVLAVGRRDGTDAVLKLRVPGVDDFEGEARTYDLAGGRGLARVYDRSDDHRALLMERLGVPVADLGWSVGEQIDAICRTLEELWRAPVDGTALPTGARKANWLAGFIDRTWRRLDRPCARRTRDRALDFAAERAGAHSPATSVLVHADAHEQNLLTIPGHGDEPGAPCKFVDPDGLFAEPACDLAVPMRGWSTELREAPVRLGRERCTYLAELCECPRTNTGDERRPETAFRHPRGVETRRTAPWQISERAIWQWGFMERVSTGLHLLELGIAEEAREMLEVADHWSRHPGP